MVAHSLMNGSVALGCQVHRMNSLPAKVLQTVVVYRMSLLSRTRFVGWV
ncbi:hypothetical protein [Vibrio gallaecicus]|nr:hypothetical protein [Vibrio gallaecicus]MDN3617313.1 hypothetical protein [Vibrio gallaecicus]MDN3617345.1 hypothetical protein [Vibrio gallaecicus]